MLGCIGSFSKRAGFQLFGKFLFVGLSSCFVSFLYPLLFQLLPQSEFLAFLHSVSSHGAVCYCATCVNCGNFYQNGSPHLA